MTNRIAFVTYETPFAPCGGVTAVMNYLPEKLKSVSGLSTDIITPYHYKIAKTSSLDQSLTRIGELKIPYRSSQIRVEILEYLQRVRWIFLKVLDKPSREPPFFAGENHPYDVSPDKTKISPILTRDSMLFGVSAASTLYYLDPDASWIILMQDWEAATTVLASQRSSFATQPSFHLTLHNSYDSGLPTVTLRKFAIDAKQFPGQTVLNRSLPKIGNPIYTVSGQFAKDLISEVFLSKVLAPHLVDLLESRLYGINNGQFTKLAIDQQLLDQAIQGNYAPLEAWKKQQKEVATSALVNFQPTGDRPFWGNSDKFFSNEGPWFVVAGRDDPRQKGFDVAGQAANDFLTKGGQARFLFFPIPGDEGRSGLNFLKKLATRFPENVMVIPAIFKEGYSAALQGSAFGIMPSLYEPFGMANEFCLNGTVAIGRATGGILQQIVPIRSVPSFDKAVQIRANAWHARGDPPTGFLFREAERYSTNETYWQAINATDYRIDGSYPDRIEQRKRIPLFKAMAKALETCITDAVALYQSQPQQYCQLIVNGITYIQNNFSWDQAAQEYLSTLV